jgi:chromosome segregation ATPase
MSAEEASMSANVTDESKNSSGAKPVHHKLVAKTYDPIARNFFSRHPALSHLEDYVSNLDQELEKIKRESEDEIKRAQVELRHLRERIEETTQEIERLNRIRNGLETQIDALEGSLDEERKKNAIIDKQVRIMTKDLAEARAYGRTVEEKLDLAEKKNQEIRVDLERLAAGKSRLESRLEDREKSLDEERRKALELDKQARRLSRTLLETQNKVEILDQKIEDNETKYQEQLKKLNQKMTHEIENEVRSFQNRIESCLSTEYKDYEKVETSKMTVQIGENLRHQMKMLFTRFSEMGIDLKKTSR